MKMRRVVNLEFLLPIGDYFSTLELRDAVFDWALPAIISIGMYFIALRNLGSSQAISMAGYFINFIAIIIGFSIACITIFATSSSKNIEELRKVLSRKKAYGAPITLYQIMLATFMFMLIMSILSLTYNLIFYFFIQCGIISENLGFFEAIDIFLVLHILFLALRNMTNFYHVLRRNDA